ncbi:MAG: hypothetical protein RQ757_12040 [Pseudomonadales bacterium]|nr:hypothetical protein [Pseudomonadales bacterium]
MSISKTSILCSLLLLSVLAACSTVDRLAYDIKSAGDQTGLLSMHQLERSSSFVFPAQAGFVVEIPEQCRIEPQQQDCQLGLLLNVLMGTRFPRVMPAYGDSSLSTDNRGNAMEYTVHTQLLSSPPRIDELSGAIVTSAALQPSSAQREVIQLDDYEIRLLVLESVTGRIVDVSSLSVRAGLNHLSANSQQKLLYAALTDYVQSLAGY